MEGKKDGTSATGEGFWLNPLRSAGVCAASAALFLVLWLVLERDVVADYRKPLQVGMVESWIALLALQGGAWLVTLGWAVDTWSKQWPNPLAAFKGAVPRVFATVMMVGVFGVFLFYGEVGNDPYRKTLREHGPFGESSWMMSAIYGVALLAMLFLVDLLNVVREGYADIVSPKDKKGTTVDLKDVEERLSTLRDLATSILSVLGLLIALAVLGSRVLAEIVNAHFDAMNAQLPADATRPMLSPLPVPLYGLGLTLLLAAIYIPVHRAGQHAAESVVSRLDLPLCKDDIVNHVKVRETLHAVLHSQSSGRELLISSLAVLAPLLSALSGLSLGG